MFSPTDHERAGARGRSADPLPEIGSVRGLVLEEAPQAHRWCDMRRLRKAGARRVVGAGRGRADRVHPADDVRLVRAENRRRCRSAGVPARGRAGEKPPWRTAWPSDGPRRLRGRSLPELPAGLALTVFGEGRCSGKQSNERGGASGNCAHATDIGRIRANPRMGDSVRLEGSPAGARRSLASSSWPAPGPWSVPATGIAAERAYHAGQLGANEHGDQDRQRRELDRPASRRGVAASGSRAAGTG